MMKTIIKRISFKLRHRARVELALVAAVAFMASTALVSGTDTSSETNRVPVKPEKPASTKPEKPAKAKKLTGQELYAINCNRCHTERYATEFNSIQWKTLMMHMRVRANLPAAQAKIILKYLQEDAGN
jgi:mono/diheme cytochrome c family protein